MGKILLLAGLICFASVACFGQKVDCGNIGFEEGTTKGWILTNGTVENAGSAVVYSNETTGIYANGLMVTKLSDGNDPKITSEAIPMVAPGSNYALRIGNTAIGGRFERAKTSFVVGVDNTLFQYKFAIVLENPRNDHEPFQKPGFNVKIYDAKGNAIACSNYDIQLEATNTVDGFKSQGDFQFRNWTTGAMDLRDYIGETITVEVTAHGCTKRRHIGYAYFDAQCVKSELKQASNCPDPDGFMTLIAPFGFGKYTWSNGATTQQVKVRASLGDIYHVKVIPLASLDESCALQLDYQIVFRQTDTTITTSFCDGESIAIGDTTYRTTGNFSRKINRGNVCDSTVYLNLTVNPRIKHSQTLRICEGDSVVVGDTVYRTEGVYVRLVRTAAGCDSVVTTNLTVDRLDLAAIPNTYMVAGDSVQLIGAVEPPGAYRYVWQPSTGLACSSCPETWAKPLITSTYTLTVTALNEVCKRKEQVTVTVQPCGIYAPDAFSPNNDQDNDVFFVYGNSCVKQIRAMVIYDRWGEEIYMKVNFAASDPQHGWDGNYHGQNALPGMYPYKIKVEFKSGELFDYKGVVTLLR